MEHDPIIADADDFIRAFAATYLIFHRRDEKRSELSGSSRAVLQHLAHAGPLTIGEAARHLDRAQSVVSDIVTGLAGHGLVERRPDARDRRRTLVWLTPAGIDRITRDAQPLSRDHLIGALQQLTSHERTALIDGLRRLIDAAPRPTPPEGTTS